MMKIVVYLNWKEQCFRANESDLSELRSLLSRKSKIVRVQSDAAFKRELKDATHVITWHFKKEWYCLAPKLRLVATPAAGRELIELPDGTVKNPPAMHFGHFHGAIMSENVAAFMLAHCRGFLRMERDAPDRWPRAWLSDKVRTLAGTKAVIAGYGNVGKAIGAKLAAHGVEVRGLTHSECDELKKSRGKSMTELLRLTDWFVMALPSTTGTDDFLDSVLLAKLPRHCVIVNVGRGNSIDEVALVKALKAKRIAAAYLDVIKREPSLTVPLFKGASDEMLSGKVPNLFLTPHSSAFAKDYVVRCFKELVDDGCLK